MHAMLATETSTPGLVIIERREKDLYGDVALLPGWQWIIGDAESQGDKIRALWPSLADYDWVGWGGDDQRPITPHWDRDYINALTGTNLVSCNDDWTIHGDNRHPPGRLAGFWCFSGPLLRAIGYWYPSKPFPLHHTCLDDIYEHIDKLEPIRTILWDILIEHDHPQKKGANIPEDETAHRAYHYYGGGDELRWQAWRDSPEPIYAVERIRKLKEHWEMSYPQMRS
jgi:hypothetical protein